jgi:hypothetical protein
MLRPDIRDAVLLSLPSAEKTTLRVAPLFTLGEWAVGGGVLSVEAVDSTEIDEAMHASVVHIPELPDSATFRPLIFGDR